MYLFIGFQHSIVRDCSSQLDCLKIIILFPFVQNNKKDKETVEIGRAGEIQAQTQCRVRSSLKAEGYSSYCPCVSSPLNELSPWRQEEPFKCQLFIDCIEKEEKWLYAASLPAYRSSFWIMCYERIDSACRSGLCRQSRFRWASSPRASPHEDRSWVHGLFFSFLFLDTTQTALPESEH